MNKAMCKVGIILKIIKCLILNVPSRSYNSVNSLKQIKSKSVILPIVAYAISLAILSTIFLFQQNVLVNLGMDTIYLSIVYGLFFVSGSIGSYIARHLNRKFSYEYISGAISLYALISIIVIGFNVSVQFI